MNAHDFEKQLRQQPFRTLPRQWRAKVLQAAQAAVPPSHSTPDAPRASWWREFLLPWRWHLAGMGAVWMLIAVLNATQSSASSPSMLVQSAPSPRQVLMALQENRRQILELIAPNETETSSALPTFVPRRRSELERPRAMA